MLQLLTVRVVINYTNLIKNSMKSMQTKSLLTVNKMKTISVIEIMKTDKGIMTFYIKIS